MAVLSAFQPLSLEYLLNKGDVRFAEFWLANFNRRECLQWAGSAEVKLGGMQPFAGNAER